MSIPKFSWGTTSDTTCQWQNDRVQPSQWQNDRVQPSQSQNVQQPSEQWQNTQQSFGQWQYMQNHSEQQLTSDNTTVQNQSEQQQAANNTTVQNQSEQQQAVKNTSGHLFDHSLARNIPATESSIHGMISIFRGNSPYFLVLQGSRGSGKTEWCRIFSEIYGSVIKIVSYDDYFVENQIDSHNEITSKEVYAWCKIQIEKYIKETNYTVIFNARNLEENKLAHFFDIAEKSNRKVMIMRFHARYWLVNNERKCAEIAHDHHPITEAHRTIEQTVEEVTKDNVKLLNYKNINKKKIMGINVTFDKVKRTFCFKSSSETEPSFKSEYTKNKTGGFVPMPVLKPQFKPNKFIRFPNGFHKLTSEEQCEFMRMVIDAASEFIDNNQNTDTRKYNRNPSNTKCLKFTSHKRTHRTENDFAPPCPDENH